MPALVIAVAPLTVALVSTATAAGGARVVGDCVRSQVKPAQIIIYCADANGLLKNMRWSSFGGATARGSGSFSFNDCSPSCAAGRFHSYPVKVTLSQPARCPDGHTDYRVADAIYSSKTRRPSGPAGKSGRPGKLSLSCPLKG